MTRGLHRGVLVFLLATNAASASAQPVGFRPKRLLDPQPPITDFPTRPVREIGKALLPGELVLGVTIGKESRAYPINTLTGPQREILNDSLGGRAIAATW